VPIAAGERAYDLRDCQRLINAGVSVLQPDVIHIGGTSAMVAAAELCDASSVSFAPHNASGPVATAATLQLAALAPTLLMQEMFAPLDIDWKDAWPSQPCRSSTATVRPRTGPAWYLARRPGNGPPSLSVRDLNLFEATSILSRPVRDQGHDPAGK